MTWGELKLAPLSTNNQTEESAAAPFANYERLKWACRMTGIFILVDDLVNAHDRDPTLIAGFRSVVDGKGVSIKQDCHPRTFSQIVRLTREWWE
ncbi:hypothetical protein HWV62_5351 [Athelia sp. TMB]|nr:hypothetical protein HWV62_5351 [Athelia sp. TMB]